MTTREHGTRRGYDQHRYAGEPPCDECRAASAASRRKSRAASAKQRAKDVAYSRARQRAFQRLADMHVVDMHILLREERERIANEEQEGP